MSGGDGGIEGFGMCISQSNRGFLLSSVLRTEYHSLPLPHSVDIDLDLRANFCWLITMRSILESRPRIVQGCPWPAWKGPSRSMATTLKIGTGRISSCDVFGGKRNLAPAEPPIKAKGRRKTKARMTPPRSNTTIPLRSLMTNRASLMTCCLQS